MRLVGDISCFNTHTWDWKAWQPVDLAAYAAHVDAVWVRWSDWSGYVRWGQDPGYTHVIDTLRDMGKPVGGYLFPRPGWTNPAEQIAIWHKATPPTTWAPMLDPEAPEGLRGPALTGWIDAALAEMAQRFQTVPWLYTQASKVIEWGLGRPATPHRLILAGYGTDQPYPWSTRPGWQARTYASGVPDTPPGWDGYDAWQFTQKAELPGMAGLVDASWVTDDAWQASAADPLAGELNDEDRQLIAHLLAPG